MVKCDYDKLDQTAEIGMYVRAADGAALFACAAAALFALMGAEAGEPGPRRVVNITALDAESLLVDWLNELLYLHETTGRVYNQCAIVAWTPTHLTALVEGRAAQGRPARAVKAVTYDRLRLMVDERSWRAEVYVDA